MLTIRPDFRSMFYETSLIIPYQNWPNKLKIFVQVEGRFLRNHKSYQSPALPDTFFQKLPNFHKLLVRTDKLNNCSFLIIPSKIFWLSVSKLFLKPNKITPVHLKSDLDWICEDLWSVPDHSWHGRYFQRRLCFLEWCSSQLARPQSYNVAHLESENYET